LAHWVDAQGTMTLAKNVWTYPHYDVTLKQHQTQTFPIKKKWTTRLHASLEDLNSSLTQSVYELSCAKLSKKVAHTGLKGLKQWFPSKGGIYNS